ncbi:SH3 domain-containing protein [Rhodoferax saidenbachensis]|nr:SH3 domain-containing protein [Rhodoferax saidenbachensis]
MKPLHILALSMAVLAAPQAYAENDTLLIKRPAELRQAPGESSPSLQALPVQTPVTRLPARQGAWIQVKTAAGATGWVHMFDVGTTSATTSAGNTASGALRGLTNFFNRGSAQSSGTTTTATSTVGIRGLGAEDINNAQPNLAALTQVEGMRTDATQARRFATEAPLKAQVVEALPAPTPPPAPPAATSGGFKRGGDSQ